MAPFTEVQLTQLLGQVRLNNARLAVTGMLLYHEGSFLQVLEGEQPVLEKLFEVIGKDKRHHRVVPLLRRELAERHFADWQMGFASLKNLPQNMPGYSEYLRLRGAPTEVGNAAAKLLAGFRDGRFRSYVSA